MGVAVIAVVFVAGLFGVPSLFGHGTAHAGQPQTQTASVQSAQSAQSQSPIHSRVDPQAAVQPAATEMASDDIVHP